jgi:hypothetical protein
LLKVGADICGCSRKAVQLTTHFRPDTLGVVVGDAAVGLTDDSVAGVAEPPDWHAPVLTEITDPVELQKFRAAFDCVSAGPVYWVGDRARLSRIAGGQK